MKLKLTIAFFAIAAFGITVAAQSVVVTRKKIEYKRPNPESEYKASFEVNYPKIKAATPALSRKIEKAISYESAFDGFSVKKEQTEIQWLQGADYEVEYNKNGILGIKLFIEGAGAYPSGSTKYVNVDTKTGTRVRPADAFTNTAGLLKLVRAARNGDVNKARAEMKKERAEDLEAFEYSIGESAKYHPVKLDQFSISAKGITFHHDYDFPHVSQALQPDGEFFFSWAKLRPYIKAGGLLSRIGR